MSETLTTPGVISAGDHHYWRYQRAMSKALGLAIQSVMMGHPDMPVGAVALSGKTVIGYGKANDVASGNPELHAEVEAVNDAREHHPDATVDTIVTSFEPCGQCQDYFVGVNGLQRVVYCLPRTEASDRNLVKSKPESAEERVNNLGYDYSVLRLDSPEQSRFGLAVLDSITHRDADTGIVTTDRTQLLRLLVGLNYVGNRL